MSKNNKTPFQLKPKHLIRALFLVSFIAVAALVAGVFSTLNSGKTDVPEKNSAEQTDTRIEVWRPNGAVEPETVQPAKDGDAKTASGNPVVSKPKKATKPKKVQKTTVLPHTAANAQKTNAPKPTNQKKHNPTTAALPLKTHLKQTASR